MASETEGVASVVQATGLDLSRWAPEEVRLLAVSLATIFAVVYIFHRLTDAGLLTVARDYLRDRRDERRERADAERRERLEIDRLRALALARRSDDGGGLDH